MTKGKHLSKTMIVIGIILVIVAGLEVKFGFIRFFGMVASVDIKERLHQTSFNSADWKNPKLVWGNDPIRIRMIDDLMANHHITGMTKAQVIALLGKPDTHDYQKATDWDYYLGLERGWLKIDYEYLTISFDSRGRVIKVSTYVS